MDIRSALKQQYHSGLAMFRECIEICPDDVWSSPNPQRLPTDGTRILYPGISERPFWRIAFHNAFFTHLYLGQNEAAFQPPPPGLAVRDRKEFQPMWQPPWSMEPYELALDTRPCSKAELLEYLDYIDGLIDPTVDGLDLDSEDSGFHWYKGRNKLSHELMNLRHLQGHAGQLSELLMMRGIDIRWVG